MGLCGYLRLVVCDDDVAMQDEGATALWIASQNGHAEVVAALLASGANVNQGRTVSMCGVLGLVQIID